MPAKHLASALCRVWRASVLLLSLAFSITLAASPTSADGHAPLPITHAELASLTYPTEHTDAGAAPLTDGSYSEPAAPGSTSRVAVQLRRAAYGAIDGRPAAAAVLATSAGGTGRFYDLHLVMRDAEGAPQPVAARTLGDRIRLQGLTFIGDALRIDFTGFAPADSFCCPTLNIAQEFALIDGRLELVRALEVPALLDLPQGFSLVGWLGRPAASGAILGANPQLHSLWTYDAASRVWIGDGAALAPASRTPFTIRRGNGLFVWARTAAQLSQPLLPAPPACPPNPGPPHPVDPSMIVYRPGNGERLSGPIPVAGLARAFEANVRLRVLTADGRILADTFTTASTGGPAFGDFAAEIPVSVSAQTDACVQIFEESARDGSLVNLVQIGVVLMP